MQIKQIKIDHWYDTNKGFGQCVSLSKTSAKFAIRGDLNVAVWLSPKEVKYELPKDAQTSTPEMTAGSVCPTCGRPMP